MNPEQLAAIHLETVAAEAELCRQSLPYFRKKIFKYQDFQPFHSKIDEFLASRKRYKLINIPRNHLKSSAMMSWIAHMLLKNPNLSFLFESSLYANAKNYTRDIKHRIQSDEWTELFGEGWNGTPWRDNEFTVGKRDQLQPAASVTASGLDKVQTGQHYDYVLLDDLVDEINSRTEQGREKVKERYRQALSLLRPGGTIIVIGTPWDRDDLYAYMKEDPEIVKHTEILQFEVYNDDGTILYHQKFCESADEEFESRGTKRSLDLLRTLLGPYQFSCQYRIDPDAEEFSEFKTRWFHHMDSEKIVEHVYSHNDISTVKRIFIDPALGRENSKEACETAIITGFFTSEPLLYVMEDQCDIIDPGETVERAMDAADRFGLSVGDEIHVEAVLFQEVIVTMLEQRRQAINGKWTIVANRPAKDKDRRIRNLFPYYRFGQIIHSTRIKGGKLEHQLERFPKERLKDAPDCLSQFCYACPDFPLKPRKSSDIFRYERVVRHSRRAPLDKKGSRSRGAGEESYLGSDDVSNFGSEHYEVEEW